MYIIDYKKKEHQHGHHRHSHEKKKQHTDDSKATLTKRQKAALEKLEQISNNALDQPEDSQKAIIEAVAAATTKVLSETKPIAPTTTTKPVTETSDSDKEVPPDSSEIDLENEPIQKKRERQRSLVLNLGKKKINLNSSFCLSLRFLQENITPMTHP